MKFEYETKQDDRECVAYIDGDGDLIINSFGDNGWVAVNGEEAGENNMAEPEYNTTGIAKKFYPGDKITITF